MCIVSPTDFKLYNESMIMVFPAASTILIEGASSNRVYIIEAIIIALNYFLEGVFGVAVMLGVIVLFSLIIHYLLCIPFG